LLDFGAVLRGPALRIAEVRLVFERQKRLLRPVLLVERKDARGAFLFRFEAQEPCRRSHIEH
jgi:hypothetical protein